MTTRDDLISTMDNARQIIADMGLRRYTVAVRVRTWSGGALGSGTATNADLTLEPPPKVERLPVRLIASTGGIYEEGDLTITKISASYTETQLSPAPTAGVEVIWLLNGESFRPVTRPEQKNLEWRAVVRRMTRPRGG